MPRRDALIGAELPHGVDPLHEQEPTANFDRQEVDVICTFTMINRQSQRGIISQMARIERVLYKALEHEGVELKWTPTNARPMRFNVDVTSAQWKEAGEE